MLVIDSEESFKEDIGIVYRYTSNDSFAGPSIRAMAYSQSLPHEIKRPQ
jgi:hypothetical protein